MSEQMCDSFGIFWDIENCPISGGKLAADVVNTIRKFVESKCDQQFDSQCMFCCACDVRKFDDRIIEGLNRSGVDIFHVNSRSKMNADEKLKKYMNNFIDHHSKNATIVLISGDIDFAETLRTAIRKRMNVILIYGQNTSRELLNTVKNQNSFNFYEIINNFQNQESNASLVGSSMASNGHMPNNYPATSSSGTSSQSHPRKIVLQTISKPSNAANKYENQLDLMLSIVPDIERNRALHLLEAFNGNIEMAIGFYNDSIDD